MAAMEMVVDKFHFRNHVDGWCKANCNPHKSINLEVTVMLIVHVIYFIIDIDVIEEFLTAQPLKAFSQ